MPPHQGLIHLLVGNEVEENEVGTSNMLPFM